MALGKTLAVFFFLTSVIDLNEIFSYFVCSRGKSMDRKKQPKKKKKKWFTLVLVLRILE
jgi:hypothetical protein